MASVSFFHSLQNRLTLAVLATLAGAFVLVGAMLGTSMQRDAESFMARQQAASVALLAAQVDMALEVRWRALEQVASDLASRPAWDAPTARTLLQQRPILGTLFNTDVLAASPQGLVLVQWIAPHNVPEGAVPPGPVRLLALSMATAQARTVWVDAPQGAAQSVFMAVAVGRLPGAVQGYLVGRERIGEGGFLTQLLEATRSVPGEFAVLAAAAQSTTGHVLAQRGGAVSAGADALQGWPHEVDATDNSDWLQAQHAVPGTPWRVAARVRGRDAMVGLQNRQRDALWATFGIAALALMACTWAIRRSLAPLNQAIDALALQAQRHVPQYVQLPTRRRDEVGVLIAGFNRVLGVVHEREQALRQSRQRLDDILNHLDARVYLKDAQGRYLFANRSLCQALGVSADALVGRSDADFFDVATCSQLRANDEQVLQGAGSQSFDEQLVLRTGVAGGTFLSVKLPMRDLDGGVEAVCGISTDISERQQQEQARLLEAQNHRTALVREVHHRIKNNLQGILALLRQHARAHPQLAGPLQQAIGQVQSISTLHGLQGRSAQAGVLLCDLVDAIAAEVAGLWSRVIKVYRPQPWQAYWLAESEAVPIALILHELMLNAVKHSHPPVAPVSVQLYPHAAEAGVDVSICNAGTWAPGARSQGSGLGLMAALMPRHGARLDPVHVPGQVCVQLSVWAPVVVPSTPEDVAVQQQEE